MNLRDHIVEWLTSIGADGLMVEAVTSHIYRVDSELERAIESWGLDSLVPAHRHADGSYHTEPDDTIDPCIICNHECCGKAKCDKYQSWLSRKGEDK